jgi:hypothetical protein
VFANLTVLLFEGVRLADMERRPPTHPGPGKGLVPGTVRGAQRPKPRAGHCAGPGLAPGTGCAWGGRRGASHCFLPVNG